MRDLSRLLRPNSVAVIGGGAWGRAVVEGLRRFGYGGDIWPVHPTAAQVGGVAAVPSLSALPGAPDAAYVAVNRDSTIATLAHLSAMGAGGAVCFASGFSETNDGADRQAALVQAAGDMAVLGPNCYGFLNALDACALWPDVHGLVPVPRGVAIVTQSSNIALNLTMQARGLPMAYVVCAGNQAQTGVAQIGIGLLEDARVTALGLHVEGFGDLRAFEALAARAHALGKPVVVLKAGASEAARAATISHTASLAGSDAGAGVFLRRLGFARVSTLEGFLETLGLLHQTGGLPPGGIAALSCSGGEASLVADLAQAQGVDFAPLTPAQTAALTARLGPMVRVVNPLDYHTFIWGDVPAMTQVFAQMLTGDAVLTLLIVDFPRTDRCVTQAWDSLIQAAIAAQAQAGGRLALVSSLPETLPEGLTTRLCEAGLICLHGLDAALQAVRAAQAVAAPKAAPVVLAGQDPDRTEVLTEHAAKAALAAAGVAVPRGGLARGPGDVAALVQGPGPWVVKSVGPAHKSDTGGVRLGLEGVAQVTGAAQAIGWPVLIEEQITGGVAELLLGIVADPAHGYVLTLGAGGVLTELWQDSASLLLPASEADILESLKSLRIWPLLAGYRGRQGADLPATLAAIRALAQHVANAAPALREVEVNPLILTPTRAVAADALIRRAKKGTP